MIVVGCVCLAAIQRRADGVSRRRLALAANRLCSLWGLNPRPMAHKTVALTTELRELGVPGKGLSYSATTTRDRAAWGDSMKGGGGGGPAVTQVQDGHTGD